MPGSAALGPGPSPQQALASDCGPSDSSKVITRTPSCLNAGEDVMAGTHCLSHSSALARPPGCPSTQGESCPSWQRLGVIIDKFGVVATEARSVFRAARSTSFLAQSGEPVI